ncbi:MAG: di-trans,poly-cis-decaprenylcistransferase [Spirochaetaceae bacterium]|nr:di-trans,poly-cis-decaprenylcistransferase [Spirochaetaceae bacterium]
MSKDSNSALPVHVGIIMDGNGRWARERGLPRTKGHYEGLTTAKNIVRAASDAGIQYVTLYVFSTENWKRTADEVGFIMGLVKQFLRNEMDFYRENKIRVRYTGDQAGLSPEIWKEVDDVMQATKDFPGLQVVLALNYGGRDEICRAMRQICRDRASPVPTTGGGTPPVITIDDISAAMDNPDIPDPDLIIRTAGEFRTSNFLLWEAAYAEYYISDKFWPDFNPEDFSQALHWYQHRDRRFGAIGAAA